MQQELIEMLEEIIQYVEVWNAHDQEIIDKAEALVEKAKNSAKGPAVPQVPVLEERSPEYWASKYPVPLGYALVKKDTAPSQPSKYGSPELQALIVAHATQSHPVTLRDYADSLIEAGHEFWKACRRDAGGGAVRWLSCDDGTLIVFTRGEYRDAIMGAVGGYRATEVVFEDQANDEQGGVVACAATSQPLTDEVFRPIVKAVFDAGWATCRASELVGDNAKEFAWDMYGDELTERLIAAILPQEPVTLTDEDILRCAALTLGEQHVENCGLGDIKEFASAIIVALREKDGK